MTETDQPQRVAGAPLHYHETQGRITSCCEGEVAQPVAAEDDPTADFYIMLGLVDYATLLRIIGFAKANKINYQLLERMMP